VSTNFNLTSDQLVGSALRKLAVLGDGQSPSTSQLSTGTQALNVMLKTLQTKGMPLWAISEMDVPMTASRTIGIGPTPLKVLQALILDNDSMIPLNVKTHNDYNLLGNPSAVGVPVHYWYETTGVLHLWPTPDSDSIANKVIRIVYQRQFNDMVAGTDTLDFPNYWIEAVIYGLAHRLSPEYGIPLQDRQLLAKEAEYFLTEALSFGTEEGSMFFVPDRGY
jgi:hypothetical protein